MKRNNLSTVFKIQPRDEQNQLANEPRQSWQVMLNLEEAARRLQDMMDNSAASERTIVLSTDPLKHTTSVNSII